MKTQLIYLDPHDDHASARDKLTWARADRVVLIWPPHGRILSRRLDLTLIQRAAASQAIQVGLVTQDPDVRAHAASLGLAVFDSPDLLADTAWGSKPPVPPKRLAAMLPRPLRPPPAWETTRATSGASRLQRIVLAILPLLALLSLAVTIVPAAVVEVSPLTTRQSTTFAVLLDVDDSNGLSPQAIPARRRVLSLEGELRQPTTGSVLVPSARAAGSVTFRNLTADPVVLPAGVGVQTLDGVRFLTETEARLDASLGSEAVVPVLAADPGGAGNVAAGAIQAVAGSLGTRVTVNNDEPTSGGDLAPHHGVSAEDGAKVRDLLRRQLLQEARSSLEAELGPGDALAPDSIRVARVVAESLQPAVGEPGDSLRLTLTVEVEAVIFREADLSSYAGALLEQAASPAVASVPGSLSSELDERGDGLRYSAHASRRIYRALAPEEIRHFLAGQTPAAAADRLTRQIDLSRPPRILLWPSWLPRLPLLPVRIEVHLSWDSG